jgi:hypothetical protein
MVSGVHAADLQAKLFDCALRPKTCADVAIIAPAIFCGHAEADIIAAMPRDAPVGDE